MDRIYGLLMVHNQEDSLQLYTSIQRDWNVIQIHKALYEIIGGLIESSQEINIMTVSDCILKAGHEKSYLVEVSKMTNKVGTMEVMYENTLLNKMDYLFKKRRAEIMVSDISKSIELDEFKVDKYKARLESSLKELETNVIKSESNSETIVRVLQNHDKAKAGEMDGIELPFSTFRRIVLLEDVDFMVIGARPAMGKTAMAISLACGWAFKMDLKVTIFALEMSKAQMMRRILAHQSGVDSNRIKYGDMTKYDRSKVEAVYGPKLDNITIIEGGQTVGDIASEITRQRPDVVIVDYLQKIRSSNPRHNMYETVTYASNGLKAISQNMALPVLALAQLSRDSSKLGKRPSLPDLRQSGEIEQDASIVGFIHRPEYYGELDMENGESSIGLAEIIIAKNREGDCGIYQMRVDLPTSKFSDQSWEPEYESKPKESDEEKDPF